MSLTTISPNIACSLNLQGNAHHWRKNTLILAGKYHTGTNVPMLTFEGKCSCLRAKPAHFVGHLPPGHHQFGGHWQQPTAEQLALRSTAVEVARLFVIAARTSQGNAEQQAQLRAFLERSRKELSDLIYGTSQQPQHTNTEDKPEVEQA